MIITRQILTRAKTTGEYGVFHYLDSLITNDTICTQKIKSGIAVAKTEFHKTILFASKGDFKLTF